MSLEAGRVIENYTIERCLSEIGGMSTIYLAYETERPTRYVTLKMQLTGQRESVMFQDLLREEAALLRSLRHPGIVRILPMRISTKATYVAKAFQIPDTPWYYAMEYLGDYTLATHIKSFPEKLKLNADKISTERSVYSIDWSMEMFYQICVVVEYMHSQKLAHGDLKPDNILFRHLPSIDVLPQPILIDFGSACKFNNMKQLTASPGYSPPEVMRAVKKQQGVKDAENIYPEKIDVWSLGTILFELLSGRPLRPMKGMGFIDQTLIPMRNKKVRRYRQDVHESVEKLLQVMLSTEPQKRPKVSQIITAVEEKIFSIRPPRLNNRVIPK
ncbi:MAG: serine/threonine-protein kinase [Chloroflexota bacterium]